MNDLRADLSYPRKEGEFTRVIDWHFNHLHSRGMKYNCTITLAIYSAGGINYQTNAVLAKTNETLKNISEDRMMEILDRLTMAFNKRCRTPSIVALGVSLH